MNDVHIIDVASWLCETGGRIVGELRPSRPMFGGQSRWERRPSPLRILAWLLVMGNWGAYVGTLLQDIDEGVHPIGTAVELEREPLRRLLGPEAACRRLVAHR